jgi:hypothetical protein
MIPGTDLMATRFGTDQENLSVLSSTAGCRYAYTQENGI